MRVLYRKKNSYCNLEYSSFFNIFDMSKVMKKFKFLSNNITPDHWVTHQRTIIQIPYLSTSHIFRIINCLKGVGNMVIPDIYQGHTRQEWITIMEDELIRRHISYERI